MKKLLTILALSLVCAFCAVCFSSCGVEFKISFIVDGEVYAVVNTSGGETVKMPENPTKDDYTFDGWFWDNDIWEKPFTANSLLDAPLSSDMSVYAKWRENDNDFEIIIDNSKAEIVFASGFTFDGNSGSKSVSNQNETYSFINQIQVSENATWTISMDIYGIQTIATKTIPLNIGDNTVYLLITSGDGKNINLYNMTVRRRPIYTVNFNTDGGTAVASQQIEESGFATEPNAPSRADYTFTGWNYNFNEPIIKDVEISAQWTYYTLTTGVNNEKAGTITKFSSMKITVGKSVTIIATTNAGYTFDGWYDGETKLTNELSYTFNMPSVNLQYTAKWTVNTDTKYYIEYYLENLDGNYSKQEQDTAERTGTTDEYVEIFNDKPYEHFNFLNESVSGMVNGDGSLVLKFYYIRQTFYIRIAAEASESKVITLSHTYNGQYKYGDTIPDILFTFTKCLGYEEWWYLNGDKKYEDFILPSFTVEDSITYTAMRGESKSEMRNFVFTSTATTCTITRFSDAVSEIEIPNYVTAIGDHAFSRTGITNVIIPNSVTSIGKFAFAYCKKLTNIIIPESIGTISNCAFLECENLSDIKLNNGLICINQYAFSGCTSLQCIIIPTSVREIGHNAFGTCPPLVSGENTLGCESLERAIFENTLNWKEKHYVTQQVGTQYKTIEILNEVSSDDLSNEYKAAEYLKSGYIFSKTN